MAIAAQRFNFLDRETNVGVKDFTQLVDNSVYTGFTDTLPTSLEEIQDTGMMDTLQENLDDLSDMVKDDSIAGKLKDAMDVAMNTISKMELPDTVKKIFESVKNLDLQGVKDFLSDMLRVGSRFLCNNLDFLKLFMLGYALNRNILGGLLIALILSWLDRYCKGFTAAETAGANGVGKLGQMIPNPGTIVTTSSAFGQFSNYYSDFLKATKPLGIADKLPTGEAITKTINGFGSDVVGNTRASEMTYAERNSLVGALQGELVNYSPSSQQYRNILQTTGDLKNVPLITTERRDNNLRYESLSDKFGSYIKNLGGTNIQPSNFVSLNDVQKGLYAKMEDLKKTSNSTPSIQNTPNDSFSDYDLASVLPSLSDDEKTYLIETGEMTDSHRVLDLHPTSSVFLEA